MRGPEHGAPARITLDAWQQRYTALRKEGLEEPAYGGPLERHLADGDLRLNRLLFDDSPAALRLWNFLLTENDRLHQAREQGWTIIGTMKDLGTAPILAYALPRTLAFYPDGAWWIPCVMELSAGLLERAGAVGLGESLCPVRAMAGAFLDGGHFPRPDLVACSVGATCDDMSAIAQVLSGLGVEILWWEMPARRPPESGETPVVLPGGARAPASLVAFVRGELHRLAGHLERLTGEALTTKRLKAAVKKGNRIRGILSNLRHKVFNADPCPLPALELLIAEMLAIHYCSDREEAEAVLADLLAEVDRRIAAGVGPLASGAVRVFWVNPVADLQVMNLLEGCGGRLCGTDLLFCHALDPIPEDLPPLEALARCALADPMVGPAGERADRIVREAKDLGAEAVVVSRIPGASHCGREGGIIADRVAAALNIPVLEIEVPPLSDALRPALATRMEALVENVKRRRVS